MDQRSIVLLTAAAALRIALVGRADETRLGRCPAATCATHTAVRPGALRWTPMSSDLMEGTPARLRWQHLRR